MSSCVELFNKLATTKMDLQTSSSHGQSCNAVAKQSLHKLQCSEKKISHVESVMVCITYFSTVKLLCLGKLHVARI